MKRILWLMCALMAFATAAAAQGGNAESGKKKPQLPFELRGVWITNVDSDTLTSRERIAETLDYLRSIGINIVYPVVYSRGMTMFPSATMEREFGITIDPRYEGRDVLREVLFEAHRNGIEVVPWFEFGFSCSHDQDGGFILERHPEWAAIDQDGRLVKKNGFEWLNAFDPEVQKYISDLMMEVVTNYDVDGVQGDDRLPALPTLGGYDEGTLARYRKETGKEAPRDIKDPEWVKWRADILTAFLSDLRKRIKAEHPNVTLSLSPSPFDWSLQEYLQDSKTWVAQGLPDTLHPQLYRRTEKEYRAILDETASQFPPPANQKIFPGMLINIGKDYLISAKMLRHEIAYNRSLGFSGEVFFFHEGLRKNDNALGDALRRGPYRHDAILPYRGGAPWRFPAEYISPVATGGVQGPWVQSADGQTFALESGADGRFVYTFSAKVPIKHHVYVKISKDAPEGYRPAYTFVSKMAVAAVTVDRKITPHVGEWYYLGSWYVGTEPEFRLILRRDGASIDGMLTADQVMLLIDRRD